MIWDEHRLTFDTTVLQRRRLTELIIKLKVFSSNIERFLVASSSDEENRPTVSFGTINGWFCIVGTGRRDCSRIKHAGCFVQLGNLLCN